MTWGSISAQMRGPKMRTASACGHNPPGSLSTLTVPFGSNAAKKKLCQLCAIERTAAA